MLSVCSFCNRTRHWFAGIEATPAPAAVATAEDAAR